MTTENTTSIADKAKLGFAVVIVGVGIWAYYWLADAALVLRLLAVIAGIALGAAVAWLSAPGKQFLGFAFESWVGGEKGVWPARKGKIQTTAGGFSLGPG